MRVAGTDARPSVARTRWEGRSLKGIGRPASVASSRTVMHAAHSWSHRGSGGDAVRRARWLAWCLTAIVACSGGTAPPAPVASVQVNPPATTLSPGGTAQLTARTLDAQGGNLANRAVNWSSTNTAVATVSPAGLVTAITVGGPVTIVASSEGQDGSAVVTVIPPPVATVTVAPATPSLTPGAVVQLTATLRDASGATLTDRVVTWSSANNAVAMVSGAGMVTAVSEGSVVITATSEGRSATSGVSVVAPIVTSVSVSPSSTSVSSGGTTPLTATVRDQNNVILTGRVVTWTSSNPAIATVSPAGVVSGVTTGGPVTITATSDGQAGVATVTVTSGPCDSSTPIAIGQALGGTLTTSDCPLADGSYMDLYRLPITATGRIQFDVASTAFDAYLILFLENPDGSKVAVGADNNSAGGTDARMTRDVVAGETYLIGANSLLGGATGAYQVSVQVGQFIVGGSPAVVTGADDTRVARAKLAMAAGAMTRGTIRD